MLEEVKQLVRRSERPRCLNKLHWRVVKPCATQHPSLKPGAVVCRL